MTQRSFSLAIAALGATFTILFGIVVIPELIRHPDVLDAFAAGFVNPFAAGYAMDAITCWCILTVGWCTRPRPKASSMAGWPSCWASHPAWRQAWRCTC